MAEYFQGMANISWCYDQINSSVPDGTINNIIDRIAEIGYSGINIDTFVHVDANGKFVALVRFTEVGVPRAVTFPDALSWGDLAAAIVRNTSFVPAENVTAAFELDEL